MNNNRSYDGEVILELLDGLPSRSLVDAVKPLYDTAKSERRAERKTEFEEAVWACEKALTILEDLSRETLSDTEKLADSRGRCQLLLACINLNTDTELEEAVVHFRASKNTFHALQWSHLESLACLGLAIAQRKLRRPNNAIVACECAHDSLKNESIPNAVDLAPLRSAIEKERSEAQKLLSELLGQIPVLSDIAAGVGRIAEENIEEYLKLDRDEHEDADFGVRVVGDSMIGDGILPQAIALIQRGEVKIGEIVAAVITTEAGDEGVLKRYRYREEYGRLQHALLESSNPSSEHLVVIPTGMDAYRIRAHYDRKRGRGSILNSIRYYEDAELIIAGKFVGLVRKNRDQESTQQAVPWGSELR